MVIAGAEEAGEQAAIDAAKEAADQAAEEAFLDVIVQICEEEGLKKGSEIFGEFGGTVGVEAALLYGKKSGIAKVKEMVATHAIELGKAAGKEAGTYLRSSYNNYRPCVITLNKGFSLRVLYCVVDAGYGLGRCLGDCRPALLKG
jgi:hypothetical protein